jgi:Icc protein
MTRRNFIKWFASAFVLLSSAFFGMVIKAWWERVHKASELIAKPVIYEPDRPDKPYKAVVDSSTVSQMDAPEASLLFSMFLLSDVHISIIDNSTTLKLQQALTDISKFNNKLNTIVLGGDLTDFGRDAEYKRLRSILDGYPLPPIHANMGNHEFYDIWINSSGGFSQDTMPNHKTDNMSRNRFEKFIANKDKPYYDVWMQNVHLIMVSQESYVQEKPNVGEGAWYSDKQLEWLQEKIKEHKAGQIALVFIHQPLPGQGINGGSNFLIRAKEFRKILKPYKNVFVFSGHDHRNFNEDGHYTKETFHWISNASVGRNLPVGAAYDSLEYNESAQGCYIQVFADKVVIRGREFTTRSWIDKAYWTFPLE